MYLSTNFVSIAEMPKPITDCKCVRDNERYGMGERQRPEHRSEGLLIKAQVAYAPRTVPQISPLIF